MKEGWTYKKLGEICRIERGGSPRPIKAFITNDTNGLNWIKIGDTDPQGKYIYSTKEKIRPEGLKKSRWVEENEFLLSNSMSFGRPYVLKTNGCIHDGWLVLRDYQESLNTDFFYYLLISPTVQRQFKTKAQGSTVSNLNTDRVAGVNVLFPTIEKQLSIVARLDAAFAHIDALKANAEKQLAEARQLFQAELAECMRPKEGWEVKKLKEVAKYSIGLTYKPSDVCENGTIVLRSSNIQEDKLDLADIVRVSCPIKESLYVEKGDILMCSRNGSARLVGKVALIPETEERMTYGTFMMTIRSEFNLYLFNFFKSEDFRNQIKHGEANMINQITRYMLDDVIVNIPPLSAQHSIVSRLDALSANIKKLEKLQQKTLAECDALKQAMLREVFE